MSNALFSLPEVPVAPAPGETPSPFSPRLELAVIKPWGPSGPSNRGDIYGLERDEGLAWHYRDKYTSNAEFDSSGSSSTAPRPEFAYRDPCWFQASDFNWYGVAARGPSLIFFGSGFGLFTSPINSGNIPFPFVCAGAPGIIQSSFGNRGNFELLVPVPGGIAHLWLNNDAGLPRRRPVTFSSWQFSTIFGHNVAGVRLIQSDWGNLELVALEHDVDGHDALVHYFQNGVGGPWIRAHVIEGSQEVSGLPGFIQSSFGTESGGHGNFELVAPARSGGMLCWFRENGPPWSWHLYARHFVGDLTQQFRALHLVQGSSVHVTGSPIVHKPLVAVGETIPSTGIGYADLIEYDRGLELPWSAPSRITPLGTWPF